MNKLLAFCGLVFIGNATTPQAEIAFAGADPVSICITKADRDPDCAGTELNLNDIVFIEAEDDLDLGFNTADYLPENLDPYKVYFDLNSITYVEEEEALDFDTAAYLPKDFNPYANPKDISSVSYIEFEEEIDLGFDPEQYLPEGFNPYEVYFDLNSVKFMEEEEEVELNFNTSEYLPKGFDPYTR